MAKATIFTQQTTTATRRIPFNSAELVEALKAHFGLVDAKDTADHGEYAERSAKTPR